MTVNWACRCCGHDVPWLDEQGRTWCDRCLADESGHRAWVCAGRYTVRTTLRYKKAFLWPHLAHDPRHPDWAVYERLYGGVRNTTVGRG